MSILNYIFSSDDESLAAQSALRTSFGSSVQFQGAAIETDSPNQVGLTVTTDGSITQSDVDVTVTNSIGQYKTSTQGIPHPTIPGGSNVNDPLASLVAKIKNLWNKFVAALGVDLAWLVAILLVTLLTIVFVHGAGEGLTERA